ncbi:hypothetical protein OEB99_01445 [Actinotalea sp. M2MS4P-6]|uniref:hypothetical protein n=1 Tax=Actinotalea sp. M2MS4P-6 TaxID=2983762 RepID=UPI0021E5005D|nr:hypothetical protein [Actinotalea sp. M2MS4P-6]MCV2392961.1 hypothetical protein [Actinotalea sp. M2MS4P-6]
MTSDRTRLVLGTLGLGLGYWLLAMAGGALYYPGGVEVAWLPAGFAAAVLCLGDMRWAVGAAIADLLLGTGVLPFNVDALLHDPTVVYQTLGNTLEFLLAAYLLQRKDDSVTIVCQPGDYAYGGGAWVEGGSAVTPIYEDAPGANLHDWHVSVSNGDVVSHTLHAYVICGPGALAFDN